MALGELCCTINKIKTRISFKAGFMLIFFLQISLISEVHLQNTTNNTISTTGSAMTSSATTASTNTLASSVSSVSSVSSSPTSASSISSSPTSASSISSSNSSASTVSSATTNSSNNATVFMVNSTIPDNGTLPGNNSMYFCPAFTCTSDCYSQYLNLTMKWCPFNTSFCEITKQDAGYSVSCSASCGQSCGNTTHSNCSLSCCKSTDCLNNTLNLLSGTISTTATTKLTSTTTTTKTAPPVTQATNGKKCNLVNCAGAACYKTNQVLSSCVIGLDYCMLKKTITGSTESWEGGCSADCRKMTVCSGTVSPCYLECCNATTTTSCLKLTGDVNMPSSASQCHSPVLLTTSIMLLWIFKVFT